MDLSNTRWALRRIRRVAHTHPQNALQTEPMVKTTSAGRRDVTFCPHFHRAGASRALRSGVLGLLLALAACSGDSGPWTDAPQDGGLDTAALDSSAIEGHALDTPASLRASYIAAVQRNAGPAYRFAGAGDDVATAANSKHRLDAELNEGALQLSSDDEASWSVELRWSGIGRPGQLDTVATPEQLDMRSNRATAHRADDSQEWYLNGPLGIEQGFEISARPAGAGQLVLEIEVEGDLGPELSPDGEQIVLVDALDHTRLHYSDLFVRDATGARVPASLDVVDGAIWLRVDDRAAQYPLSIDPLVWAEQKKLMASDAQGGDFFGTTVAVSGDVAVVGAHQEDTGGNQAGAAYVFSRHAGGTDNWGEIKKLMASDADAGDYFGISVSMSGDIIVVGARQENGSAGAAYVFSQNAGGADNWGEIKKLVASDAESGDQFGDSVSVDGDMAVVGASYEATQGNWAGAAYVFSRDQGGADNWGEVTKLMASDTSGPDRFGIEVAVGGDTICVGAMFESSAASYAGAAYVFSRNQGGADNWGEVTKLVASDADPYEYFGTALAVDGDLIVVGNSGEDSAGNSAGGAFVYSRNAGGADNWGEIRLITASDAEPGDGFGRSVSLDGDTLIVGASGKDTMGNNAGAIYVFTQDLGGPDNWGEAQQLFAGDPGLGDFYGAAVGLSGDAAIVGAFGENSLGNVTGAAYALGLTNEPDPPSTDPCDQLGAATIVGTPGDDFLIGTPGDDVIFGFEGNDIILGYGGNDIICGGSGVDNLQGGDGNDYIDGQGDFNFLKGQGGDDTIIGGDDGNEIQGGSGDDTIVGGAGYEWILGGDGMDVISAGGGNDDIEAGAGDDTIDGGEGHDWVLGGDGDDCIDGGDGYDTLVCGAGNDSYTGGESVSSCEVVASCAPAGTGLTSSVAP